MTREEAIREIEKAFEPAFANYIITALTEGATVSDKEPKSEWQKDHEILKAYSDGANEILDKIRAEIEQDAFKDVNGSKYIFVNRVNQIINKYKAESEGKE